MAWLRVGHWDVEVASALLSLGGSRFEVTTYLAPLDGRPPDLSLVLADAPLDARTAINLNGGDPALGTYEISGSALRAWIPEDPFAAEAALKALYAVATVRQGGMLLHASAFVFEGIALAASGPSGAGKSTLARLCWEAGARILSDETVAFFPDGTVQGTPFRSDADLLPCDHIAPLGGLVALKHGLDETLEPLPADDAVTRLLSQAYRPAPGEAAAGELLQRASVLATRPGMQLLTFRDGEEAGTFMKRWAATLGRA